MAYQFRFLAVLGHLQGTIRCLFVALYSLNTAFFQSFSSDPLLFNYAFHTWHWLLGMTWAFSLEGEDGPSERGCQKTRALPTDHLRAGMGVLVGGVYGISG
jgi:hypothetical protein